MTTTSTGSVVKRLVVSTESSGGRIEVWAAMDPEGRTFFRLRLVGDDGIPVAPPWVDEVNAALAAVRVGADQ